MTVNASTAVQSTTLGGAVANKACDGVTDTSFFNPKKCAHTGSSTVNWWQVELTPAGNVTAVDIYFRSDCCSTFIVVIAHGLHITQ